MVSKLTQGEIDQFWDTIDIGDEDACWEWLGGHNGDGYGYYKCQRAHRLAFSLVKGKPKHYVLHRCNNRACCNPAHLYDGTHKQNMLDMAEACSHDGFNRKGEKHPKAILTNDEARIIKQSSETGISLARRFHVSPATISMIQHGKRWPHV